MSWPLVKLKDIGEIVTGSTPSKEEPENFGTDIPFVSPSELGKSLYVNSAKQSLSYKGGEISRLLPKKSVMVCCIGSLGKVGITGTVVATNQQINSIIVDEKVAHYLYVYFYCLTLKNILEAMAPATTVAIVNKSRFSELEIPLPPILIQKQIALVLKKAHTLRQQCQQMEQELNALAQSVFLEMFGDPVTNSKKWPTAKFAALGELNRGKSKHRPRNDPKLLGGIYPLIQTGDVARADNYITEYKHTYSEFGLKQSRLWKKGTLCITIAANIADTAILGFDACFPDSVVGFNANKNITSNMFVHYWLKFYQIILERTAPESAQKNINLKILEALEIFVPPINKQNEFVDILNQIESQKSVCREAIVNSETNFNSLMQRAFRGELDLKASA